MGTAGYSLIVMYNILHYKGRTQMNSFNNPSYLTMSITSKANLTYVLEEPELPFSVSDGALFPILAQHTTRYDVLKTWDLLLFHVFFRLIGFNSVNRRPYIVKSGMFQSSRNPSWAVILLRGGILSDWTFIRLVPYTCHHSGRPASNQKARNTFTEIRDSPLSRKRECMILGPRTKSVLGRQK